MSTIADKDGLAEHVALVIGIEGGPGTVVGPANPLPISYPSMLATTIVANSVFDARAFTDVEFQFTTGTVSVTRSLDGVNYVAWPVLGVGGAYGSGTNNGTAAAAGIWATDGGGYLKFSADVTVRGGA